MSKIANLGTISIQIFISVCQMVVESWESNHENSGIASCCFMPGPTVYKWLVLSINQSRGSGGMLPQDNWNFQCLRSFLLAFLTQWPSAKLKIWALDIASGYFQVPCPSHYNGEKPSYFHDCDSTTYSTDLHLYLASYTEIVIDLMGASSETSHIPFWSAIE